MLLTNHVTTRLEHSVDAIGGGLRTSRIVPALGEYWSHCITNRILLEWSQETEGVRRATLVKSPSRPMLSADYVIKPAGVRDYVRTVAI